MYGHLPDHIPGKGTLYRETPSEVKGTSYAQTAFVHSSRYVPVWMKKVSNLFVLRGSWIGVESNPGLGPDQM
eukprot:12253104-Ditylum_brightwellii.AAC.1